MTFPASSRLALSRSKRVPSTTSSIAAGVDPQLQGISRRDIVLSRRPCRSRMRKVSPNFANHFVLTLEILLFLALAGSCSAALDSDRTIAHFAHTAWRPKDGAPSVINVLAQSADGYLWLGSTDGLYRFDGVVFERYQPQSGDPFPTQDVRSLSANQFRPDRWNLMRFRGGFSRVYPAASRLLPPPPAAAT
jgi:hypothetical protein